MDGAHLGPTQLIQDLNGFFEGEIISFVQNESIIKSRNLSDKRKNEYEVIEFNRKLYATILEKKKENSFPIVIGGDSSVTIASALASSKVYDDVGIILFSSHANYNTVDTTVTGNIHGVSLASINGICKEFNEFFDGNVVQPARTVVVGARNIDNAEKEEIKYSGATVFSTENIKNESADEIVKKAFEIANSRTKGVHVIFDLGIIDPDIASGVSVPSVDGITEEVTMQLCDSILEQFEHIIAFDLVEFNPLRDTGRKTEQIAVNILAKVIRKAEDKDKEDKKY